MTSAALPDRPPPHAAVIGAGPAGLMAAEVLARSGCRVTVYDRMASAGRKFLLAGRGGLNLTHSEDMARFGRRYREAERLLAPAIAAFTPDDLRRWCADLGQPTFIGTSGRIFPEAFKASPLLRAWLRRLAAQGAVFRFRHRWTGFVPEGVAFDTPDGPAIAAADAVVLALGGASWPHLGADGSWTGILADVGCALAPLEAANVGVNVPWSAHVVPRFAGTPLKGIALTIAGETVRGEAVLTLNGLEGGAVYALTAPIRRTLAAQGHAELRLALRPDMRGEDLAARLAGGRAGDSVSTRLRKALKLPPVAVALMQEAAHAAGHTLSAEDPAALAGRVNDVAIRITGLAGIDRAISTAGGLAWSEIDADFMLTRRPGTFVAGEMLDWEAPTGGYLLQASFATGAAAGRAAAIWAAR